MNTTVHLFADFVCALLTAFQAIAADDVKQPSAAVLEAQSQRIAVIEKALPAVLAVFPPTGRGGGSGVVISPDGYALTNFHVVLPCGKAMKCGMADGKVYDAVLVGIDPTGDVALIKLFGRDDFPFVELADSDKLCVGDWVFAAGNPFLLAADLQPTVTFGLVSGVHRYQYPSGTLLEYADCIQTDAAINPGNSGGPLFNMSGQVVGINGRGSFEKRGRVHVGAAYAISSNQIKNFLGALRGGRIVDHATLGAIVASDEQGRPVIDEILEDSDAYRRGLREGDEIVAFGGRPITSANGFKNALGIFPKGWRVPLSFRRDGRRYDILVRLAGVHGEEELLEKAGTIKREEKQPMPLPEPPDQPNPTPPENPQKKPPFNLRPARIEPPLPEIVAKHYQEKRGFANYYFNVQEQRRVWQAWQAQGKPLPAERAWLLAGERAEGGPFSLRIDDAGVALKLTSAEFNWTPGDEFALNLQPPHSGGLLTALYLWRRLAKEGLERFGDVYYFGAAPLAEQPGLMDVLIGSYKGVDCRFYFEPQEGRLLALEFFADPEADPCEVYFSDYRQLDGYWMPARMEVRYGNDVFAVLNFNTWRTEPEAAPPANSHP